MGWKHPAGVLAHRVYVTNRLDNRFDGDTGSQVAIYIKESMDELYAHFGQAASYINPKGGFLNSPYVETVERVIVGLMRR